MYDLSRWQTRSRCNVNGMVSLTFYRKLCIQRLSYWTSYCKCCTSSRCCINNLSHEISQASRRSVVRYYMSWSQISQMLHIYIKTYLYICIYIHICLYKNMYVYVPTKYIYTNIYAHIQTHRCTHRQRNRWTIFMIHTCTCFLHNLWTIIVLQWFKQYEKIMVTAK